MVTAIGSEGNVSELSATSSLTRKLAQGVVLPNISPLTDPRKSRITPGTEQVAERLERNGYEVGWDDGRLQVTPAGSCSPTLRGTDVPPWLYSTGAKGPAGPRPRTPSFLTFKSQDRRPNTSGGPPPVASTGSGTSRFSRLACSMDAGGPSPRPGSRQGMLHRSLPEGCMQQVMAYEQQRLHALSAHGSATGPRKQPAHAEGQQDQPGTSGSSIGASRPGTSSVHGEDESRLTPAQRAKLKHPMGRWRPSRGHTLMVFNQMDTSKQGRLTKAEFEMAALSLGYTLEQALKLFTKLDTRGKGYVNVQDWGNRSIAVPVESWTLRYMQRYMGLPDVSATPEQVRAYWKKQDTLSVKNLVAAVNMVRVNAVTRGAHSASASGNAIFDTFRFMDTDGSGDLSKDAIKDAFFALGVFLSEKVSEQIMHVFDGDNNGTVNYHEFVRTMFPNAARANAA